MCYRAPNTPDERNRKLNELLSLTQKVQSRNVLVMGDFNYPQIDWEMGRVEGTEASSHVQFFDVTQDLFWCQHVNFPTPVREGCAPSILDLVFSDDEQAVSELIGSAPLGKSDHIVVTWKYLFEDTQDKTSKVNGQPIKRNFKKANYKRISEELGGVDWTSLATTSVNEAWEKIESVIMASIETHVSLQRSTKAFRPKTPWWSTKLLREVKLKHASWKKYSESKSTDDHQKYILQRNRTTQAIRNAQHAYENAIVQNIKEDPKKLFKYVRSQQSIKPGVGPLEKENGELAQSDTETAEVLNNKCIY